MWSPGSVVRCLLFYWQAPVAHLTQLQGTGGLCSWSGFREYYFWNLFSLQKVQEIIWSKYPVIEERNGASFFLVNKSRKQLTKKIEAYSDCWWNDVRPDIKSIWNMVYYLYFFASLGWIGVDRQRYIRTPERTPLLY